MRTLLSASHVDILQRVVVSTAELGTGNGVNTSHPLSNVLSYISEFLVALVQSMSGLKKPILIYLSKFVLFLLKVLHFLKKIYNHTWKFWTYSIL